jgi:hypothetical protein
VHWTVYIFHGNGQPLQSTTRDLSSSGFYCLVDKPLAIGERIWCQILVPSDSVSPSQGSVCLRCRAKVQRVERCEPGKYGIGWIIEDYSVVKIARTG